MGFRKIFIRAIEDKSVPPCSLGFVWSVVSGGQCRLQCSEPSEGHVAPATMMRPVTW